MAKITCALIILLALCATQSTAQIQGVDTTRGAFPAVVSITSSVGPLNNCLGNVVNELHVLTAASCVVTNGNLINPFWLTINGGDLNLNVKTYHRVIRNVTTIYPHFQFNANTNANNLAVLRVGERFPFPHNTIEGAILATQPIFAGCRLAGWNANTAVVNATIHPVQRVINVPMHTHAICNQHLQNRVLTGMICGGGLAQNSQNACPGAIGGGLYCGSDNQLTGILAFNTGCGAINQPGVYIEVRHHMAWINQQFTRVVRFPPGTPVGQTG